MRGIGSTFSRLPAARAFLAGAAILAGASASKAYAQPVAGADELALAQPRILPNAGSSVPLPQPLPPAEAARWKRVFALQRGGNIQAAATEVQAADITLEVRHVLLGQAMLGHALADRYLGRFDKPGADQLQSWLTTYPDQPSAPAIRSLLIARQPRGSKPPPAIDRPSLAFETVRATPVPEESEPAGLALNRTSSLDQSVHDAARGSRPGTAARLLDHTRGLSPTYASQLRGEAGQILFFQNRDAEAFDIAAAGATPCGDPARSGCRAAAVAGYVAGLAAWRMGRPELAQPMFEASWHAELTTSAQRAAAAFWAARAHLRNHDPAGYTPWMTRAAAEDRTFYGFLARRTLGLGYGFGPGSREDREMLTLADVEAVGAEPPGMRAFALLQIGQTARAEAELRLLWPMAENAPPLGRAIMLVAQAAGLTELAAQLADLVQTADGRPRTFVRFPIPSLQPNGGFRVDPAMIYGIARTESNFNASLISSAGARGIMQIMPDTASFIVHATTASGGGSLDDPQYNLDLGQHYIQYLASHELVNNNLVKLLASYNSGPGSLAKWGSGVRDNGDPLLFIEAIPIDETRAYVPRVLTYTWIYATRMRLPTPSLDELAAGAWPAYHERHRMTEPPPRMH